MTLPTARPSDLPAEQRKDLADLILRRYLAGEQIRMMASEMKVSGACLYALIVGESEEKWKIAQMARALSTLEDAEDDLRKARDPIEIAKQRELLRSAQWNLEMVARRIYGNDVIQNGAQTVQIHIGIVRE